MNEKEKEAIEELKKQLRLAINIDDVTTAVRNDNAKTILNLIEKQQKELNRLKEKNKKFYEQNQIYLSNGSNVKLELHIKNNYIRKDKIKDKIEELNSRIEKYREYVEQGIETDVEWVDNVADRETVKVLQELIEGKKMNDKDTHTLQNQLDLANADIVEKDKIIDLMANFMNKRSWKEHQVKDDICFCCKIEYSSEECVNCIKQYFEKKVRN